MKPERIALFGGTFDPIHLGHLEIARLAKEALELDKVIFLPCRTSPHKQGIETAPAADRLEMVRLAIAELPWAEVDDHDLAAPAPSYSYLTAEEMARRHPDAKLFWLMGADQWRALPRWAEPGRLARVVDFIVFARDGAPLPHSGWEMHAFSGTHPASATAIREAVRNGNMPLNWLPAAVADYIFRHQLYACSSSDKS
ncbi:MAG: nicotinate (nicotinamide) nucleotide adenylyltransferase [Akkermansiaceae bacterium]|nr:nicotinate (nicotinamide) nucleotide adenylyltransferase [Akkermansiaceae bacterium]